MAIRHEAHSVVTSQERDATVGLPRHNEQEWEEDAQGRRAWEGHLSEAAARSRAAWSRLSPKREALRFLADDLPKYARMLQGRHRQDSGWGGEEEACMRKVEREEGEACMRKVEGEEGDACMREVEREET